MDSICTAVGAIVDSLTKPYGYTPTDNAIAAGAFVTVGILGSFFLSAYLDKHPHFKRAIIGVSILAVLTSTCLIFTLPSKSVPLFVINIALLGVFTISMTPISQAFSVELTYPTPESMSNGIMTLPNKLYGVIIGLVGAILSEQDPKYAVGLFILTAAICGVSAIFLKEEHRRLDFKKDSNIE